MTVAWGHKVKHKCFGGSGSELLGCAWGDTGEYGARGSAGRTKGKGVGADEGIGNGKGKRRIILAWLVWAIGTYRSSSGKDGRAYVPGLAVEGGVYDDGTHGAEVEGE